MTNIKNYILYGVIILVAVITGVAIGSVYVSGIVPSVDTSNLTEATLRDDENEIAKLYEDAVSGRKTSFSAVELYQIGEYKLKNTDRYVKILSGSVESLFGITQNMKAIKTSTEDGIYYLKMSPAKVDMAPSMAVKQRYEYDNPNEIYLNETRDKNDIKGNTVDEYYVDLDESTAKTLTLDEYKSFFNTEPTTPLTYIVSDLTTQEGTYDKDVTLNSDNQYVFNIKMTGEYATYAAFYYSYEIRHFSGDIPTTPPKQSELPSWKSVEMTVTMDSDFNILSIHYLESYDIDTSILPNAPVNDDFEDVFYYDDETIEHYLALSLA